jgi:hypothetical protein
LYGSQKRGCPNPPGSTWFHKPQRAFRIDLKPKELKTEGFGSTLESAWGASDPHRHFIFRFNNLKLRALAFSAVENGDFLSIILMF